MTPGDRRASRASSCRAAQRALCARRWSRSAEHERPTSLLVAVAVAALLAVAVAVGAATVHDLSRHGGSLPGAIFLTAVLVLLAVGMYQRRYWAVLGFEALLAFQILVTSLALVVASTILAALSVSGRDRARRLAVLEAVRVMGRIQAGEQPAESAASLKGGAARARTCARSPIKRYS